MTDRGDENSIAKKVHELLLDSHPQLGNRDLAAALELASAEVSQSTRDIHCAEVVSAIQRLNRAVVDHSSAAETEQLLLQAIAAAQHWVSSSS
jgi:hypothetical protein